MRRSSPTARCSTGGSSASCTRWSATSRQTWRRSTPRLRGAGSRPSSTTCPTGTCAGPGAASGRDQAPRRDGGLRHAVRVRGNADPADGAVCPVPDRLRVGRAAPGRRTRTRCTWPRGPPPIRAHRRPPVRADGAGPAAGRAGPLGPRHRPCCGCASRSRGRWSAPPASAACLPSCAPRSPTSSTSMRWTRWPASARNWWISRSSRTSARSGGGSAERHLAVAAAIEAADASALAAMLRSAGSAPVLAGDGQVTLAPDDVIVTQTPRSGWAVARRRRRDGGAGGHHHAWASPRGTRPRGVRLVQDARKGDGLDVSDRISLQWSAADPELTAALTEHGPMISSEVLADRYGERPAGGRDPALAGCTPIQPGPGHLARPQSAGRGPPGRPACSGRVAS